MLINIDNLKLSYDQNVVVKDFSLQISSEKITTIIGPNGSGKSSLLKGVNKLLNPVQGSVSLDDIDIKSISRKKLSQQLSILSQHCIAPDAILVKDLIACGRNPHQHWFKNTAQVDAGIIDWAMHETEVAEFAEKTIYELSGGELQRVWIATVLAQKSDIICFDEPTSFLDIAHQIDILRLIKRLNRSMNIGVVMVLHDINQALQISDHLVVLKDGNKFAEGAPTEIISEQLLRDVYNIEAQVIKSADSDKISVLFPEI